MVLGNLQGVWVYGVPQPQCHQEDLAPTATQTPPPALLAQNPHLLQPIASGWGRLGQSRGRQLRRRALASVRSTAGVRPIGIPEGIFSQAWEDGRDGSEMTVQGAMADFRDREHTERAWHMVGVQERPELRFFLL